MPLGWKCVLASGDDFRSAWVRDENYVRRYAIGVPTASEAAWLMFFDFAATHYHVCSLIPPEQPAAVLLCEVDVRVRRIEQAPSDPEKYADFWSALLRGDALTSTVLKKVIDFTLATPAITPLSVVWKGTRLQADNEKPLLNELKSKMDIIRQSVTITTDFNVWLPVINA